MQKTQFSEQPDAVQYVPHDGTAAEVSLRRNITKSEDSEGNTIWIADEVKFTSYLSKKEIMEQFDSYFLEDPEPTVEDLAEAINILTTIILEG